MHLLMQNHEQIGHHKSKLYYKIWHLLRTFPAQLGNRPRATPGPISLIRLPRPLNLLSSLLFFLICGCGSPTEFNEQALLHFSPEEVVESLAHAYGQKNLELYMSSFSEECEISDGSQYLWGKEQERSIHQKMFRGVKEIDLNIGTLRTEEATETNKKAVCDYRLTLRFPTEQVLEARGEVALELVKNELGAWYIGSLHEIRNGLGNLSRKIVNISAANDSIDYFPLRVGNYWTYEEQFIPTLPGYTTIVTDSVIIRGNLYYSLQDLILPFFMQPAFVRVDSLQQLKQFFPADSSELTIFNFAALVGDTLIIQPSDDSEIIVVELISQKDSVTVPAGKFANVLEFLITDFNSGGRFTYEFAADIGLIRQTGTNQILALKKAYVNAKKYPLTTSVEARYLNWTQVKLSFI